MPAASHATAARAVRVALAGDVAAADAPLLVRDDDAPFALVGRWAGATALAGGAPRRMAGPRDDPFAVLDEQPAVAHAPEGFVGGGWFGMLGYGLGRRLERHGGPPPQLDRLPEAVLGYYDHVVRRDADGRWWFEALWTDERAAALEQRRDALAARLAALAARVPAARPPLALGAWTATPSPTGHARAVAACVERIAAGDLFQANLSLRLRGALDGDLVDVFQRGVSALAPDRAAWLAGSWGAVASLSPELFVERHGDLVRSAPIKGTRPRPADPVAAAAQRAALAASAKDRAENVMIVDLMRNDLGRVCAHGSVAVTALAEVRPHAGVWHLVSEVRGRRRPDVRDGDLVAALFPPGSVTGAPKLAAMEVISELESAARQAFCGAFGFASPAAGLELGVAIRTFECRDGRVWLDVGGGVVADSDPDAEAQECLAKAAPLLAALGAQAPDALPAATDVPRPLRLAPRPVPRPDPAQGVFETLLVGAHGAVALDLHLERLATSARELYEVALPEGLAALAAHAALEQGGACRLRLLLEPDGAVALQVAPLPEAGPPAALQPVTVPGGIGAHKWRDRRLLEALEAAEAPATPLLVDLDGHVLETTRANVFAVLPDALVTPPLDGRVLPGVTRARVLAAARALELPIVERVLTIDELRGALSAFLTGALRGVQPVAAVGAVRLSGADDLTQQLAAGFAQMR